MRRLAIALVILALILFEPVPAYGCSCMPPPPPSVALEESSAVFEGLAASIAIPNQGEVISSADPVLVTFQVSRVWKGPREETITVRTSRDEASCGFSFVEGQQYLVYAVGSQESLEVSLCSRTTNIEMADRDLSELGEAREVSPPEPALPTLGTLTAVAIAAAALISAAWVWK